MLDRKLGRSVPARSTRFEELLEECCAAGLDTVDFDLCGFRHLEGDEDTLIAERLDWVKKIPAHNLALNAVHLPFGRAWDVSAIDEAVRTHAIERIRPIVRALDAASPVCYVLHGSYEPIEVADRAKKLAQLERSLGELTALTRTPIAVEILPRTCLLNTSAEAIALLDAVKTEQIGICVDVNHFLQETAEDGVRALGDRILTTHISDHDYLDEKHWMPGKGKIDWMRLLEAFEAIGYQGSFNYEVDAEGIPAAEIRASYDALLSRYRAR